MSCSESDRPLPDETPTTARLTRLVFVVVAVSVTITMVIASVVMNTPAGPHVAIPGPLSAQHAMLTEDCSHCHSAEMDSTKGVLHGINSSALSIRDSAKCLDCHDLGGNPMLAHSLSEPTLAAYTRAALAAGGPGAASPSGFDLPPHTDAMEFACSVCHVEHGGRHADLTAMTEAQCQSCHTSQFEDFQHGHPPFGTYPYDRRLRIAFDHGSHIYHNFLTNEQGKAPTSCTDCHSVDSAGEYMLTASFEESCAACHENDVRGTMRSGGAGVAFFALPAIDTISLDEAGIGIGQWPADAGIAESGITPFMRLLLSADPAVAADLTVVDRLDLLDLLDASDEELESVARVAWAIKALAQELADGGHGAIASRIRRAVGAGSDDVMPSLLAGALPRALVRDCVSAWLPDLASELDAVRGGDSPGTDMLEDAEFSEIDAAGQGWTSHGGWYRDDMAFAIKYRTTGHADGFLGAWLDLAAAHPAAGEPLLDSMAQVNAVGQCLKCHSVDAVEPSDPSSALLVNWKAARPSDLVGRLTRFSHAPHLPMAGEQGCIECHKIEPQTREFELSYRQRDPGVYVSSLAAMDQASCAECHTPAKVATTCLDCHDYHAHRPSTRLRSPSPLKPLLERGSVSSEGAGGG